MVIPNTKYAEDLYLRLSEVNIKFRLTLNLLFIHVQTAPKSLNKIGKTE